MSMAVCEALLAGLPCIVSDKSRPAGQLEHGKNGFYFSSSNELTDYVRRIASLDYNGKEALHRMVRSTVEGVSKDAQAQAMLPVQKGQAPALLRSPAFRGRQAKRPNRTLTLKRKMKKYFSASLRAFSGLNRR